MPEKDNEVKTIRTRYFCDECEEGQMISTGLVLTCYPPLFEHKCNACHNSQTLRRQYPFISHSDSKDSP